MSLKNYSKTLKNYITPKKKKKKIIKLDDNPDSELNKKKKDSLFDVFNKAKKFLDDHKIKISTITLDCKLHTMIDVDIFAKYVELKEDGIVSIKFGNRWDAATNRTIIELKKKKKSSNRSFFNQVTILMRPQNNKSRNYINIKVFKNGSLQMTGCKDMDDFLNVSNTLIQILKDGGTYISKSGKRKHVDYIDSPTTINIYDAKIRMINSNFKVDYEIDRKKLSILLRTHHNKKTTDTDIGYVEHKFDPSSAHSCVNIKHITGSNKTSIFVFKTGSIIITGARKLSDIISAYTYINKILEKYETQIKIIVLNPNVVRNAIYQFLKEKSETKKN